LREFEFRLFSSVVVDAIHGVCFVGGSPSVLFCARSVGRQVRRFLSLGL
jgi:hypothetical protein